MADLTRNRHLARSISDAAWGELARQLTYKAAWYGAEVVVAPRWFPSSKTCSRCGRINPHLNLAQRSFGCERALGGCGLVIDRDLNAAINLAAWAEAEHPSAAQAPDPQAGGRVTNACGGTGTGHGSHRGETGPEPRQGRSRNRPALLSRQPERTPEKGAAGRPARLFDRL